MKFILYIFLLIDTFYALAKPSEVFISCELNQVKIDSVAKCKNIELDNPTRLAVDFPFEKEVNLSKTLSQLPSCAKLGIVNIRQNSTRIVVDINGKIENFQYKKDKCETRFTVKMKPSPSTEVANPVKAQPQVPIASQDLQKKDIHTKQIQKKPQIDLNKISKQDISSAFKVKTKSDIIIAIDAGHGGFDPGTMHNGLKEKDVTLKLAQTLNKALKQEGYSTVMTRNSDIFIPLKKRIQIARESGANFMISIHVDYERSGKIEGSTVYTISDTFWKENNLFKKYKTDGLAPEEFLTEYPDQLSDLLVIMMKSKSDELSLNLSKHITKEFKIQKVCNRCNERLASFVVLHGVDIPCILIESAYISNKKDVVKLKSKDFFIKFSDSIVKAIDRMFLEKKL